MAPRDLRMKHFKEVLLDLLRGEVVENINLAGVDRAYVCIAISSNKVYLTHCALRLKKSGTVIPRMELVEVGGPASSSSKRTMRTSKLQPKKKIKNVSSDAIEGTIGKIYIPDQKACFKDGDGRGPVIVGGRKWLMV
ncbi:hypothetical protein GQ457_11G032000 [Hibiscus cannabinus]